MIKRLSFLYALSAFLSIWLVSSCQAPSPSLSISPSAQASAKVSSLNDNDIKSAHSLIRSGTKDRIELLYNDQHQAVNWMVVFDPPKILPESDVIASQTNGYHVMNTQYSNVIEFFTDKYSHLGPANCTVATFRQPTNISDATYFGWYSRVSYGGWRSHPDPWISEEGCRPRYSAYINNLNGTVFGEPRYTEAVENTNYVNLTPSNPLYFLARPGLGLMEMRAPCRAIGNQAVTITLIKNAACDGSSPAFQTSQTRPAPPIGSNQGSGGSTPTTSFCHRSLQKNLDNEEARLRQLELDLASLAARTEEENFSIQSSFQIQQVQSFMVKPSAGPYTPPDTQPANTRPDFNVSQYASPSASYDPSSYPSHPSVPTPTPTPNDVVPQTEVLLQINMLKDLATQVQSRLEPLEASFLQSYNEARQATDPDSELIDLYADYLAQTTQIKQGLQPIQLSLQDTLNTVPFLCTEPEPEFVEPQISLVYSNIDPDGSLVVHGRVSGDFENFDLSKITLDFKNDIELQTVPMPQTFAADPKRFVFRVPFGDYVYTSDYQTKVVSEGLQEDADQSLMLPEIRTRLGYCDTPGCFQTNRISVRIPEGSLEGPNLRSEIDFDTCQRKGFIDILDVYILFKKQNKPSLNDIENNYNYTLHYLQQHGSDKACILLKMTRKGQQNPEHIFVNTRELWQAYNSALLLLGNTVYDISKYKQEMPVSSRDIRLLLQRVYAPTSFTPKNVPANLLMLIPNSISNQGDYEKIKDLASVQQPDTEVRTKGFTLNNPDMTNGNIGTRWPTICDDYKHRIKNGNDEASIMLESVSRYHLLNMLRPGSAGSVPNIIHPNAQIWVSQAENLPSGKNGKWESDNILYQGDNRGGKFGIHVIGIAESKMGSLKAAGQIENNISALERHKKSQEKNEPASGIILKDIVGIGVLPNDIKVWDIQKEVSPFIKLIINAGDSNNKIDAKQLRAMLNQGIVPAAVPETTAKLKYLVNEAKKRDCR